MRTSYMWTGGIKKKIATVPPLSSEMPLYKGHPHGETMAEGLPKRLPKGLPMLQHILIADTPQKGNIRIASESSPMGSPLGRPLGRRYGKDSP